MKLAASACRVRATCGHTVVEMVVVTGVVGALAAGIVIGIGDDHRRLEERNLESRVEQLNRAVEVYRASGGRPDGLASFEAAFVTLKSVASPATADGVVGLTGSMIDAALTYELQTEEEAAVESPRVRWDPALGEFVLADSGAAGAKRFYVDAGAVPEEPGYDDRTTALAYALESSWVWDYSDRAVPVSGVSASIVGAGVGTGSPVVEPGTKLVLDPPVSSPAGGVYPWASFPVPVTITDPNPSGVSMIVYTTDGTTWSTVESGAGVTVAPNDDLVAYCVSIDPDNWLDSFLRSENYVRDAAVVAGAAATSLVASTVTIAGSAVASPPPIGGDSATAPAPFTRSEALATATVAAAGVFDLTVAAGSSTLASDVDLGSGPRTTSAIMEATGVDLQVDPVLQVSAELIRVEVVASGDHGALTSESSVVIEGLEVSIGGIVVGSFSGTVTASGQTLVDLPLVTVVANRTTTSGDGIGHVARSSQALFVTADALGLAGVELVVASAEASLSAESGASD